MDEEDLKHLVALYNARNDAAAAYGFTIAPNAAYVPKEVIAERLKAFEEADDALADALCEWTRDI